MTNPCCETCRWAKFPKDDKLAPGICDYPPLVESLQPRCEVRRFARREVIWRPGFTDCPVYEPIEAKP